MDAECKFAAREHRDDVLRLREEIREELRDIAKRTAQNDLDDLKETIREANANARAASSGRPVVTSNLVGDTTLAKGGTILFAAAVLFTCGTWMLDYFGHRNDASSTPRVTFKPVPYTVRTPVKETVLRDETYTVRRPVTSTIWKDETYTVQKAVPYTDYRDEIVNVYKPTYKTVYERREVTVPTLTPVQVYVDGYWTTEWRYVDRLETRWVSVRKKQLRLVEEVRKTPFESLRYVSEERTRKVPVEQTTYVEEQKVRQVPEERVRYVEEQRYRYEPEGSGVTDDTMPAPAL